MRNEVISALEEARGRALSKKNKSAEFIQDSYNALIARTAYSQRMTKVRQLQKFYRRRLEKRTTLNALKLAIALEKALAEYKTEKRKAVEEIACHKIGDAMKAATIKEIIVTGVRGRNKISQNLLRAMGRYKIRKVVVNLNIVFSVFRKAWSQISRKMLGDASRTLVRITKGYLVRKAFASQIALAKEKAYIFFFATLTN